MKCLKHLTAEELRGLGFRPGQQVPREEMQAALDKRVAELEGELVEARVKWPWPYRAAAVAAWVSDLFNGRAWRMRGELVALHAQNLWLRTRLKWMRWKTARLVRRNDRLVRRWTAGRVVRR